jgi:hypothetical protein
MGGKALVGKEDDRKSYEWVGERLRLPNRPTRTVVVTSPCFQLGLTSVEISWSSIGAMLVPAREE